MQPSQMMTSRELCDAEDCPDLPAWKRPCGSRGVGSWRGAHLAMLVVRPFGRCSRSSGLPCSPLDDPLPAHPRGLPPSARSLGSRRNRPMRTSHLRPTSEPSPFALADSTAFSPGFVRTARYRNTGRCASSPLHRHPTQRPLPRRPEGRRFGLEGSTPEVSFRPRGFSPPRRLPPLCRLRACCIPLPILGSTALLPAVQDRTPRRIPRRQPFRVTAVVAPLPFLPASRPCSVVESGVAACRCQLTSTRSSLGFVPLQGSLRCGRRSISHRHLLAARTPEGMIHDEAAPLSHPAFASRPKSRAPGHPRRRSGVGVNRAR